MFLFNPNKMMYVKLTMGIKVIMEKGPLYKVYVKGKIARFPPSKLK